MKNKIIIFVCSGLSNLSLSQESIEKKNIITDRPDQTESAQTVWPGYLQIETGALFERLSEGGVETEITTFNTTLMRLGLFSRFELRIAADWQQVKTFSDLNNSLQTGMGSLFFGIKKSLISDRNGFDVAWMGTVLIPTPAAKSLEPEDVGGELRLLASKDISDKWSIGVNAGISWDGNNTGAAYFYTLSSGHTLSKRSGFFVELYGDVSKNDKPNHLIDAGFTYLIHPGLQLDFSGGTAIEGEQEFFLSAGISYVIPLRNNSN